MSEIDELFDLKNSYYLGNFSHTVNEANKLKLSKLKFFEIFSRDHVLKICSAGEKALERDVYLYRAMIGQKQFSVLNAEIKSSAAPQLLAVKAFATFLSSGNSADSLKLLGEHFYFINIRCFTSFFRFPTSSSCTRKLGKPSYVCCYSFTREELRRCS